MKINRETDYALRIMRALALKNGVSDANEIAENVSVSQSFTLKILRKLLGAGLVVSHKGANGGYELAYDMGKITLRRIVETIEGPLEIARCLSEDFVCEHEHGTCVCYFNRVFDEINLMIAEKLEGVTLADVVNGEEKRRLTGSGGAEDDAHENGGAEGDVHGK